MKGNWSRYVTNGGSPVDGASITVEKETGGFAVLEDRVGTVISNPFTTSANGLAVFFTDADIDGFKVTIVSPDGTEVLRNQPVGMSQYHDVGADGASKLLTRDQLDARYNAYALDKADGTVAPAVTDDSDDGYSLGSRWYDTTASPPEIYVCLDATVGAAVWVKTTLTLDELGSAATLNAGAGAGDLPRNSDLGSASLSDTNDFATAAQGATADTALQPGEGGISWGAFNNGADPTTAPTAATNYALALGEAAIASSAWATTIGLNTLASANGGTSIGAETSVTATYGTTVGYNSDCASSGGGAFGQGAYSSSNWSYSMGYNARSDGGGTLAFGSYADAGSTDAVAISTQSFAGGTRSISIGTWTNSNLADTVLLGGYLTLTAFCAASHVTALGTSKDLNSKKRYTFEHKTAVRTTDATVTSTMLSPLTDGMLYAFKITIIASEAGGYFQQTHEGLVECTAGTATLVGALTSSTAISSGTLTASSTVTVSTNDLIYQVTGEAAKTVDWSAFADFKAMAK